MEYITNDHSKQTQASPASKWQAAENRDYIMSNEPEAADSNPPEPVPCKYCGKPRYTKGLIIAGRVHWYTSGPERCGCPEALAEYEAEKAADERREAIVKRQRVESIIKDSGMSARFQLRTFDRFQVTDENERALRACKFYADNFRDKLPSLNPEPGRNGLFITGPMGTGKTHLAAAIANQLMHEGTAVVCMTMIDLLDRIRQTFNASGDRWADNEATVLNKYKRVALLIIDDMGKEPATKWAVSKIYAIINARYEACLPTIITTNYTDSELVRRLTPEDGDPTTAAATIDRLREMCAGIITTGDSWRSK